MAETRYIARMPFQVGVEPVLNEDGTQQVNALGLPIMRPIKLRNGDVWNPGDTRPDVIHRMVAEGILEPQIRDEELLQRVAVLEAKVASLLPTFQVDISEGIEEPKLRPRPKMVKPNDAE